ncbi:hypothetical protein HanRHA438_Chr12g0542501 [Helianthus annuus]|nr:hypothetical protein HanOQP8_Chr12g0438361 [Helianthus annuus]KAJ0865624.1 hypothetical protein HanRHA438_Chr12g0542501 [Helianthus annuus]
MTLYVQQLTHTTKTKTLNMKMRNKGKVHPSSSSTTPPPYPAAGDTLSILNLLPAAILSLAVVLSVEDREVLAYMLTHSIKSTNPNSSNKTSKKGSNSHKSPVFECDCFDCYTNYWFKWDTSPNRELIHQAIEAFEENLTSNEQINKKKSKKKEKITHRKFAGKVIEPPLQYDAALVEPEPKPKPELEAVAEAGECTEEDGEVLNAAAEESPETTVTTAATGNRGVGRKVVPDVIGILNWRLWSFWSPNVVSLYTYYLSLYAIIMALVFVPFVSKF